MYLKQKKDIMVKVIAFGDSILLLMVKVSRHIFHESRCGKRSNFATFNLLAFETKSLSDLLFEIGVGKFVSIRLANGSNSTELNSNRSAKPN